MSNVAAKVAEQGPSFLLITFWGCWNLVNDNVNDNDNNNNDKNEYNNDTNKVNNGNDDVDNIDNKKHSKPPLRLVWRTWNSLFKRETV